MQFSNLISELIVKYRKRAFACAMTGADEFKIC